MTGPGADVSTNLKPNIVPSRRPHAISVVVLVLGLVAVAALSTVSEVLYSHNESRLLDLRVKDAGQLISAVLPTVETPLASAVELAEATHKPSEFTSFMKTYVHKPSNTVSASLWTLDHGRPRLVVALGKEPLLSDLPPAQRALLTEALSSHLVSIREVATGGMRRLAFAYSPANTNYVAVEENALQTNRRARLASDSSFRGLHYAIYIGRHPTNAGLVGTDQETLPMTGRTASEVIPFGSGAFLLVMSPSESLGGPFFEDLPYAIAVLGLLLTLGAAFLVERLVRRRLTAEQIATELDKVAAENRRLYDEQRNIARTLQHALLPQELPTLEGVTLGARYLPGVAGMEVGGDWYDVVKVDEQSFFVVVGDVSGRGLRAATIMAELRYAIRAYVAEGDEPETILTKVAHLYPGDESRQFATVLCAKVDLASRTLTVANAGHLSPVLVEHGRCELVTTVTGVPIGVPGTSDYRSVHLSLNGGGTLLAFTDGLVERRGEAIDESLRKLRDSACRADPSGGEPLGALLDRVLGEFGPHGFDDDTAILGVQWPS